MWVDFCLIVSWHCSLPELRSFQSEFHGGEILCQFFGKCLVPGQFMNTEHPNYISDTFSIWGIEIVAVGYSQNLSTHISMTRGAEAQPMSQLLLLTKII